MNIKRFLLAAVAVFVLWQLFDFLVHGVILSDAYGKLLSVWRPDMQKYWWVFMLTSAFLSLLFVYIYAKGYEEKGISEGIKFGLLFGSVLGLIYINQAVVYPIPFSLGLQWVLFAVIRSVIYGVATAVIYKK